jgi:hypothetical protein
MWISFWGAGHRIISVEIIELRFFQISLLS